jgi:ubiquinone/menaquinone biosynthesis C-methylase UbiE
MVSNYFGKERVTRLGLTLMEAKEFDKFADSYHEMHLQNISLSGETPDFFAEYKIKDLALQLKNESPRTILDFGSGVGNSVPYFRKYFPNSCITCADVSERSLDISRTRYPGSERYAQIVEDRLPFPDGSFNVVFSACVFHHIPHEEHAHWLNELNRVTAVAGKLFIFEHNPLNPLTVRAVRTCPFDENARLISGWTFSKRIVNAKWLNVRVHYRIFFPHMLARLRTLEKYLCYLPLGAQYYVFGQKSI